MARNYTRGKDPVTGDIIKADDFNDNWSDVAEVLNGTADHLQIDYNAVGDEAAAFDGLTTAALSGAPSNQATTIGEFNTYATNQRYNSGGNEETPVVVIEQISSDYQVGWNEIRNYSALEAYSWLLVPCKEGMLRGTVVVDAEHRVGARRIGGDVPGTGIYGLNDWFEIGVFVDNILIAVTGRMTPGRHTVNLPFALPVSSKNITVDVRWRAYMENLQENGATALSPTAQVERRPFNIYNLHLWARNQYR